MFVSTVLWGLLFQYIWFQYLDVLEVTCSTTEHNYPFKDKGDSERIKEFIAHDTSFCPLATACPVAAVLCKTCGKFYFICSALRLAASALLLAFSFYPLLFDWQTAYRLLLSLSSPDGIKLMRNLSHLMTPHSMLQFSVCWGATVTKPSYREFRVKMTISLLVLRDLYFCIFLRYAKNV